MSNCVLWSTYIKVNWKPVLKKFRITEFLIIIWVDISHIIPA